MVSRHRRRRNQAAFHPLPTCSNCGGRGSHFVSPSLGEPGFWLCLAPLRPIAFNTTQPSIERFIEGLMHQLAEATGVPLRLLGVRNL